MAEREPATADWFDTQGAPGGAPGGGDWFTTQGDPTGQAPVSTTMPVPDPNRPAPASAGGAGGAPDLRAGLEQLKGLVGPNASRAEMEAAIQQVFGNTPGFQGAYKESVNIGGQWYDLVQGYGADGATWQLPSGPKDGGHATGSAGMQAALETSPGYQFRLAEGLKGLERGAAAKGTLLTGGTAKALQRYAQDYASGEYQNRYNQLYGLSQLGLNAAGQSGALGSSYANLAGNLFGNQAGAGTDLITGGANAGAAGTIGAGNAWQQGLAGAGNAAQQAYFMWLLQQSQRPPGT